MMIRNTDPKKIIKSIEWNATTIELLTGKPIDDFDFEEDTLAPIEPGKPGMVISVLNKFPPQTNCLTYKIQKTKPNAERKDYYLKPERCAGRWLILVIYKITYTDDSYWDRRDNPKQ
jgi:hypothetical protein